MKLEIALIRHGHASDGEKLFGMTDKPLDGSGVRLINERKSAGAYPKASLVFSSGLARCVDTAKIIYPSLPIIIEKDLRAPDYGQLEQVKYADLTHNESFERWVGSAEMTTYPGGEEPYAIFARSSHAFRKICDEAAAKGLGDIAVVTHKIIIQAILQRYYVPRSSYVDWEIPYGGGYFMKYDTRAATVKIVGKF